MRTNINNCDPCEKRDPIKAYLPHNQREAPARESMLCGDSLQPLPLACWTLSSGGSRSDLRKRSLCYALSHGFRLCHCGPDTRGSNAQAQMWLETEATDNQEQVQSAKLPTVLRWAPSPLMSLGALGYAHISRLFKRSMLISYYQFFSVELFNLLTSCFRHYA